MSILNYEFLDKALFRMSQKGESNMNTFEKLILRLDKNKKSKSSSEMDIQKLQEEADSLMHYLSCKQNNKVEQDNISQESTNIIDLQMIVTQVSIKIFIGQVPKTWWEADFRTFFEKHASIQKIEVVRTEKGKHQGCVFVTFSSIDEAERLKELYKNQHFLNSKQKILMKWALGEDERLGTGENSTHKIIIKNLPRLISDKSLLNIFENFGIIQELKVIRDSKTQECQGHAFILFQNKESAHLAIQNIKQQSIILHEDKRLKASFLEKSFQKKKKHIEKHLKYISNDNEDIYKDTISSNIPFAKFYYQYQNIEDTLPIYYHPQTNKLSYEKPPPSSLIWQVDGSCNVVPNLFPCSINLNNEQKKKTQSKYTSQQVIVQGPSQSNVFIFHLPKSYNERNLYELFSGYGTILSITVCKKYNGQSKGYGFVSFNHPSEAALSIKELNGLSIMGKRIKVELKQNNYQVQNSTTCQQLLDYDKFN